MQKIVIELPEEIIDYVNENKCLSVNYDDVLAEAIANGTVIPKGHGKIGDIDRLYKVFKKNVVGADAYKQLFDMAHGIIEADKGEKR